MSIYTEEEAAQLRCPFKPGMCVGSLCLAWRRAHPRDWPSLKDAIDAEFERQMVAVDARRTAAPWWKRMFMSSSRDIREWEAYSWKRRIAKDLATTTPDAIPMGNCSNIEGNPW